MDILVNGKKISMQIDTGSDVTLLSLSDLMQLGGNVRLSKPNRNLVNFDGSKIPLTGRLPCRFVIGTTHGHGNAFVTKYGSVLGLDWLRQCIDVQTSLQHLLANPTSGKSSIPTHSFLKGRKDRVVPSNPDQTVNRSCTVSVQQKKTSKTKVIVADMMSQTCAIAWPSPVRQECKECMSYQQQRHQVEEERLSR
jgi:hypothetical protein